MIFPPGGYMIIIIYYIYNDDDDYILHIQYTRKTESLYLITDIFPRSGQRGDVAELLLDVQ